MKKAACLYLQKKLTETEFGLHSVLRIHDILVRVRFGDPYLGLSEYQISEWRILGTIGLSDQGLNLSNYRISDSQKTTGCPALGFITWLGYPVPVWKHLYT